MASRRELLQCAGWGLGSLALTWLLRQDGVLAESPAAGELPSDLTRLPDAAGPPGGRARHVILLFMGGGPSHVDTFDPKPLLSELHGGEVPASIARDVPRIARSPLTNLLASPWKFSRRGQCGLEVSELFPHVARLADDLCLIRSCRHDTPIHAPAEFVALTGTQVGNRPSLGAWLTYGLGSDNDNLPAFVVCRAHSETLRPPTIGTGFLPARYQGTLVDAERGIPHLQLPAATSSAGRRAQLALLDELNQQHLQRHAGHAELEARIRAYELSFRMQQAAPEAFDLAAETAETRRLYGVDQDATREYGQQCLLARRLVERGVRFILLRSGGWDAHNNLKSSHEKSCLGTDQPIAGLLTDLKRRGLLDSTLVVWGGEFGRTPAAQGGGQQAGRDHSPSGYSMWLAGGGIQGGQVVGATDPVGYAAIQRPVHPNDLHATILHALGIDQHRLFYRHQNRKELVTVNGGQVLRELF
ncbi:MAG: DUF1501 domain-containing protein [Pirellulaceae bacterium]|nr:DUF1501 domain-containing protein [Pirellulaceae bacterium]